MTMKRIFMMWLKPLVGASLALGIVGASTAGIDANSSADRNADSLRAMLEDSRSQQKGLTFMLSGQQIAGVVVSVTEKFVLAKNQAQGNVVMRIDRIDGVAGFVSEKITDKTSDKK